MKRKIMILFIMRMDWIAFKGILVQGSNSNWNCALDISNYYNYNQTINCLDMDHPSPTPDLFAKFHNLDFWVSVPSWWYLNIFVFLTWNLHGVQKKFLAEFGGRRWETKLSLWAIQVIRHCLGKSGPVWVTLVQNLVSQHSLLFSVSHFFLGQPVCYI